jgi:hypothetical protein
MFGRDLMELNISRTRRRSSFQPALEALESRLMPQATAAPTPDNLNWSDFKSVKTSPNGFDAWTQATITPSWDKDIEFVVFTRPVSGGKWSACVYARLKNAHVTASFDGSKSWVVDGKQSAALLAHETIHFRLAGEVADEARRHLPYGHGFAVNVNQAKAIDAAKKLAAADLFHKVAQWNKQLSDVSKAVQKAYDDATNHGDNAIAQANWENNWEAEADKIIHKTWK